MELGWTAAVAGLNAQLLRRGGGALQENVGRRGAAAAAATAGENAAAAADGSVQSSAGGVPWTWTAFQLLHLLRQYPAGVTPAMATSELERLWVERGGNAGPGGSGKRHRSVNIDVVVREGTVSTESFLDVDVVEVRQLGDTGIALAVLADAYSERRLDAYVHAKFTSTVLAAAAARTAGRPICRLRIANARLSEQAVGAAGGSGGGGSGSGGGKGGNTRLLPTPFAVFVVADIAPARLPPWMASWFANAPASLAAVRDASIRAGGAAPQAVWATVSGVDAPFTVAVGAGKRRSVRGVWLRSAVADGAVQACLRLWDEQAALGDVYRTVRCWLVGGRRPLFTTSPRAHMQRLFRGAWSGRCARGVDAAPRGRAAGRPAAAVRVRTADHPLLRAVGPPSGPSVRAPSLGRDRSVLTPTRALVRVCFPPSRWRRWPPARRRASFPRPHGPCLHRS